MARAPYRESAALRGLRQTVAFAEGSDSDPSAVSDIGRGFVTRDASKALGALRPAQVERLRQELRSFLHMRARGGRSAPPTIHVTLVPLFGLLKQPGGRLWGVDGSPRDVLLYQIHTFLDAVGEERLRVCPAPDCDRLFVKVGRREYCSVRCQRRVFVSTYDPFHASTPHRKDRHGKKQTR